MEGWVMENGAFYITKKIILQQHQCRLGGSIGVYMMNPDTAAEIDEPEDWPGVEQLLIKRKQAEIRELCRNIKLLVLDVDGTLTDAGMYYSEKGEELKKFNTRDAQGLALLREKGVEIAIITKENSPIVTARARKLGIAHCYIGIDDKLSCLKRLCDELKIPLADTAYIGDDVSDLECMKEAGFSACPSDAVEIILNLSHYRCTSRGGNGAVREVCEMILNSR
jgi:N-acylneuraminate cytidylyltransferase